MLLVMLYACVNVTIVISLMTALGQSLSLSFSVWSLCVHFLSSFSLIRGSWLASVTFNSIPFPGIAVSYI